MTADRRRPAPRAVSSCLVAIVVLASAPVLAAPVELAGIAPSDDALRAIVVGTRGDVYEPDGKGAWVRHQQLATAEPITAVTRAGGAVIASGGGVVYRLAANGWSAIRLVQHGKAIVSAGDRGVAAVGRTLFALDHSNHGEPVKLVDAVAPVLAIGGGNKPLVLTDRGLARLEGTKLTALRSAPIHPRLISDRWALVDGGAIDLVANKPTTWPAGVTVTVAAPGPGTSLAAIGVTHDALELVVLDAGKLVREPIAITLPATAVGIAIDRAGRAVVAFADGRLAIHDRKGWTLSQVRDELPAPRPGSPPATSP